MAPNPIRYVLIPVAEVVVAPPALYLLAVKETLKKEVKVAAQNCYFKPSGAFTGEIRCAITIPVSDLQ